jgi:mannose-6-phosphate isomerase
VTGPIAFEPLFMPRVWGGRALETHFGKALPAGVPIGESWELVDRADAQSVARDGPLAGTTLHELWEDRRAEIFGSRGAAASSARFPLIIKLLDASATLSVQVHPPAAVASKLGGKPKTEMWVLLDAADGAQLLAGLRAGVTREGFAAALEAHEDLSALLHPIRVHPGDVLAIPSGRVHAIGAGCLIAEIQQNSDTTYRVFDFNRPGLDGEPRELHTEQSMASIDWDDIEPALAESEGEVLISADFFTTSRWSLSGPRDAAVAGECSIVLCIEGDVNCGEETFVAGELFLAPASAAGLQIAPAASQAEVLVVELPDGAGPA